MIHTKFIVPFSCSNRFVSIIVMLAWLVLSGSVFAQDVLPYKDKMHRLAEILGSLTLLDKLCDQRDKVDWHAHMEDLLEAESHNKDHQLELASQFNEGFEALRLSYNMCTPSAHHLRRVYFEEAIDTISDLITFYGF